MQENRELLIKYLQDEELISDVKVDLIYQLITSNKYLSKDEVLQMSGYDTNKTFDTAYPQPYADRIRELYPDFNNGCHIYDYSEDRNGAMVNIYNLFAKHVLRTLSL